jgi:hypothetical protein
LCIFAYIIVGTKPLLLSAMLIDIRTSRRNKCICVNGEWIATAGQGIRANNEWIRVGDLKAGDVVYDGELNELSVRVLLGHKVLAPRELGPLECYL